MQAIVMVELCLCASRDVQNKRKLGGEGARE